jgi:hypothetical protein
MKKKAYRHGDVVIVRIDRIPDGLKPSRLGRTLAEGEVTGHAHVMTSGDVSLYEKDDVLYMHVESDEATLTHEEHETITIPNGDYMIERQREYTPEGWRRVAD